MKCIIVEDLPIAADFLHRFCVQCEMLDVAGVFPDAESALAFLDQNRVDLIFLDVEMPGATGFELLDQLSYEPKVILTTSKAEYAYDAYQYFVDDFLKKPFSYKRFLEALEKVRPVARKQTSTELLTKEYLFIKVDQKVVKLKNDDILFIESMGDYVRFVTHAKKYTVLTTLKNLDQKLDQNIFLKVHRSYIVNMSQIDDLQGNIIFIKEQEVPIGKAHKEEVMSRLDII